MSTALLENILNQPHALRTVRAHHRANSGALERAARSIRESKRVLVSGMGASLFASIPFSYRLSTRASSVFIAETSELLYFLTAQADSQAVAVLVSRSGESVEVTKLLSALSAHGTRVIGVVNVPDSTLARQCDEVLLIGSPPDELVAVQTYTATVATLALLDAAITDELDQAFDDFDRCADMMTSWVPAWVEARDKWSDFLATKSPLYLLGRGSATSSVAEGVLLMHEIAKWPAVGMSAAQFRHGPVEVVDSRFRAVIFCTQPGTAQLDAALRGDLAEMGAQVLCIGPSLDIWPEGLPERFFPVAETVPLQVLAYRKAEMQGIRPGQFRWAPAITTSETGFAR